MTCAYRSCLSQCNPTPAVAIGFQPAPGEGQCRCLHRTVFRHSSSWRRPPPWAAARSRRLRRSSTRDRSRSRLQMTPTVIYAGQWAELVVRSPGADSIAIESENGLDRYWSTDSVLDSRPALRLRGRGAGGPLRAGVAGPHPAVPQEAGAGDGLPPGALPGVPPRDRGQAAGAEPAGRGCHRRLELGLRPAHDSRRSTGPCSSRTR